jgi:hypothetical protein
MEAAFHAFRRLDFNEAIADDAETEQIFYS